MTDKELLELAAKAIGKELKFYPDGDPYYFVEDRDLDGVNIQWNPLTDDGDALRLAVKLRLRVEVNEASIIAESLFTGNELYEYPESYQDKDYNICYKGYEAATRRAIVRAAAEIGKELE